MCFRDGRPLILWRAQRTPARCFRSITYVQLEADSFLATCFVHIVAIIMTAIMILHIRSKYTAVGEFIYDLLTLSAFILR